jgi:hypothetical protein
MTENCKLRKAILFAFYNISQRNFGILLILWCSFKLWWNVCPDFSRSKFHSKGERPSIYTDLDLACSAAGEISVTGIIMFISHMDTTCISTTFPLSGKIFCRVSNFSVFKMYSKVFFYFSRLARHTSATSHGRKLYPVSGVTFSIWTKRLFG